MPEDVSNKRSQLAKARSKLAEAEKKAEEDATVAKLVDVFRQADANGDGTISREELGALMEALNMSSAHVDGLIKNVDKNGDGLIDYQEFISWVYSGEELTAMIFAHQEKEAMQKKLVAAFKRFDRNGDGTIDKPELYAILQKLSMSEADVHEIVKESDKNGDGKIDYNEFVAWVLSGDEDASKAIEKHDAHVAELTAAQEFLDKCLLDLAREEKLISKPVKVELGRDDILGCWFGRGKDHQGNLVTKVKSHRVAHNAGVKPGWRIVKVGKGDVHEADYVPDMISDIQVKNGVTLQFALPQDKFLEAQEAVARAQKILEDLEFVKVDESAVPTKPPTPPPEEFVPIPTVSVKYYSNEDQFEIPTGTLTPADIDAVYGITEVNPGCTFELVYWRPGSAHLLDYDDEDKGGSAHIPWDKEKGAFKCLIANQKYFLLVRRSQEQVEREKEDREKHRKELWLSSRPKHECAKEQFPFSINVTKAEGAHQLVNGVYKLVDAGLGEFKGERPLYKNAWGVSMFWSKGWHIMGKDENHDDTKYEPKDPDPHQADLDAKFKLPPRGVWMNPDYTKGEVSSCECWIAYSFKDNVCRICTEPFKWTEDNIPKTYQQKLLELFASYDQNGDGVLTHEEFQAVIKSSGYAGDVEHLMISVIQADIDMDGKVNCNEFLEWMDFDHAKDLAEHVLGSDHPIKGS